MTETTTDIKDGHYRLGEAYLKDKQYAEAIMHFQMALRLDADFIAAHLGVCRAYLAENDTANAEASVKYGR